MTIPQTLKSEPKSTSYPKSLKEIKSFTKSGVKRLPKNMAAAIENKSTFIQRLVFMLDNAQVKNIPAIGAMDPKE
jgi:hypothetical protein